MFFWTIIISYRKELKNIKTGLIKSTITVSQKQNFANNQ